MPSQSCSRSSGGGGESIESAISALPPARFRDTDMFAMFTPASPKSVPIAPDHAGDVVVRSAAPCAARTPSRARSRARARGSGASRADRRACDADAVGRHRNEVRVVPRRTALLLDDLDPAVGGDDRRVDVVDRLIGVPLEGAVQRGDRQQPCVVARRARRRPRSRSGASRRRRAPSPAGRASRRAERTARAPRDPPRRRSGCSRRS